MSNRKPVVASHLIMPERFSLLRFPATVRRAAFACGLLAAGVVARAGGLSTDSPFLPAPGDAAAAAVAANAKIQLAGMGVVNGKTWVCLYDTQKKRGHWFAVGTTTDGIEVLSCDDARNQAVIRAGGETITLMLRKPTQSRSVAVAVNPGVAPVITAPPPALPPIGASPGGAQPGQPALTQADKEREARMLVADLMEIGMRQRQAYEAAQKKAAEEAARKAAEGTGQ
ncbi:hypothetical protein GALL_103690 [mine drainage metagenome]|uniref:Uncharacterized protein n=1 Tax=mine drainage metagenome TaxID=410659 RepID=A0A1J5SHL8_9ZZZZ